MRATAEVLEDNKVKLSVEVDEAEIEKAMEKTYRRMARQVRIPGFRPGKVPRRVLEAKLGAGSLRLEAIQDSLPDFYTEALRETDVDAIAPPEIDITDGREGGPVSFDALVQVRPSVSIAGYQGLEITIDRPGITDKQVDAQIDRLREQGSRLEEVQRAVVDGDHVTIDISATRQGDQVAGLSAEGIVYEVGTAELAAEMDDALRGASSGEELQFEAVAPDGQLANFTVQLKQVNEKILPSVTDEWAKEASEFETLDDLRQDLRSRLNDLAKSQLPSVLRERSIEALVALVSEEPPQVLIEAETEERLHELGHRLEQQGISAEQYLAATGMDGDALLSSVSSSAIQSVKADLALRSLADAEQLVVSDDDLQAEILLIAQQVGQSPQEVLDQLERNDRLAAVRSEMRKAKALEWLVANVALVDEEGNAIDRSEIDTESEPDSQGQSGTTEAAGRQAELNVAETAESLENQPES